MNKIVRSKASGQYGKVTKIVGENVYLQFLRNVDAEPIKVSIRKILELVICEKELQEEINKRIEELDNASWNEHQIQTSTEN